jgi:predicted nucleotidyltransferase
VPRAISMTEMTDMAAAVDFARRIVPFWQAALGSELLGIYLIGSLAHGGFSRRYSDIDMAVITQGGTLAADARSCPQRSGGGISRMGSETLRVLDRPAFRAGPISSARSH